MPLWHKVKNNNESGGAMANNAYFDFDLPIQLIDMIEEYKECGNSLNQDLYQDEIRSLSRYLDDDEKEKKVIDYFCKRCMKP